MAGSGNFTVWVAVGLLYFNSFVDNLLLMFILDFSDCIFSASGCITVQAVFMVSSRKVSICCSPCESKAYQMKSVECVYESQMLCGCACVKHTFSNENKFDIFQTGCFVSVARHTILRLPSRLHKRFSVGARVAQASIVSNGGLSLTEVNGDACVVSYFAEPSRDD